ncbi:hypothetical protein [Halalkalicoccus jeotgali]|uniref:Uncharacterized protein n=1 Tax=Halalkalicoccus jeotgali (strain DSM 18796 / CECT 7217 / JCM 14584 / KCTC 4019 / B3) TaxID=795797 RepID=D8J8M4_HALJB|nr:hypothetical protein [Halalkalicoccus jeotgali]ADJ14209.1 hypothetical protein HacjB3_04090 [Halalkalicoccus jeotgali B3]ELY34609.1 hypothetical protein C497_15203 [Halalkalicoccus jeotgali B3]
MHDDSRHDVREPNPTDPPARQSRSRPAPARSRRDLLGTLAGLGFVSAFGTRPVAAESDIGDGSVGSSDDPDDPTDPDERYLQLLAAQRELRASNGSNLDTDGIRAVLEERAADFEGQLLFFAASDFGQPRVFLPSDLSDPDDALQAVLDRVHAEKWSPDHDGLRAVRRRVFEETTGVHQALPALFYDSGDAEYDLTGPWDEEYNFVTIRQVVGLVDWLTNADRQWVEGRRLVYDAPKE